MEKIHSGKIILEKSDSSSDNKDSWKIYTKTGNLGSLEVSKEVGGHVLSSLKLNKKDHIEDLMSALLHKYGKMYVRSQDGRSKQLGDRAKLSKSTFIPIFRTPGHAITLKDGTHLKQISASPTDRWALRSEWRVTSGDGKDLGTLIVHRSKDDSLILNGTALKAHSMCAIKKAVVAFYSQKEGDIITTIHRNLEKLSKSMQYFPASKAAKLAGLLRVIKPLVDDMQKEVGGAFDDLTPAGALRRFNKKWWHVLVSVEEKIPLTSEEASNFEADRESLRTALNGLSPENIPPHIETFAKIIDR